MSTNGEVHVSEKNEAAGLPHMPFFARTVYKFAALIILGWVGLVVALSVGVPDQIGRAHV